MSNSEKNHPQQDAFMAVRRAYPSATIIPQPCNQYDEVFCYTVDGRHVEITTASGIITEETTGMTSEFYPEKL